MGQLPWHRRSHHFALAGWACIVAPLSHASVDIQLEFGGAWRDAALAWDIASDPRGAQTPNVLSALEWQDVTVLDVIAAIECRLPNRWFLRADGTLGNPVSGKMTDADYAGDNRRDEVRRSTAEVSGQRSLQGAFTLGRDWLLMPQWRLQASLGAGFSTLELNNEQGYLVVNTERPDDIGSFDGLDSDYNAYWSGLSGRLGVLHDRNDWQVAAFHTTYPHARYDATARWNLRADLAQPKSFDQEATGEGSSTELRVGHQVMASHWVYLSGKKETWRATDGTDRLYRTGRPTALTRLNHVMLDSTAWALVWQRRW